jgi:SAM-dependent methyltransferase
MAEGDPAHPIGDTVRRWWDADAPTYDEAAGHALSDPVEAAAWDAALRSLLPEPPARILDVGAGTGSMTIAAAALGHRVTGLDVSTEMLALAEAKAAARHLDVRFVQGSAAAPPEGPFDAVMERHVAWTLPEPVDALRAWREVTAPGGVLVLFEGSWGGDGPWVRVTDALAAAIHRTRGTDANDHHAPYPDQVLRATPLSGLRSPGPFVAAVRAAGWRDVALHRMREVERAIAARAGWPLGALERRTRFAITARA